MAVIVQAVAYLYTSRLESPYSNLLSLKHAAVLVGDLVHLALTACPTHRPTLTLATGVVCRAIPYAQYSRRSGLSDVDIAQPTIASLADIDCTAICFIDKA